MLFEPAKCDLPAGLLASPAFVQVTRGTVVIPVVNVGLLILYPCTILATPDKVYVISLLAGVTEVPSLVATVAAQSVALIAGEQHQVHSPK